MWHAAAPTDHPGAGAITAPTPLQQVSARTAILALVVLAVSTLILVLLALPMPLAPDYGPVHGDLDTYAGVVQRLQAGVPYYDALHAELLKGGYGTLSVFNWRPPFFLSAVAFLSSALWMQAIIVAVAVVAAGMAMWMIQNSAGTVAVPPLAIALALSLVACVAPRAGLVCELLAGALILLSVSAYGTRLRWLGFATAAAALLIRELAGVYVLVCIIAAWKERRYREVAAWCVVLAVYGLYYAWHAFNVLGEIGPQDHADPVGWLRFGGVDFVLLTSAFNGIFLMFPYWVTAAFLPLAILGLAAQPARSGSPRAFWTVLGYVALFSIIGKPNNSYWGALYTPLLSLGLIWGPRAVRDLVHAARTRQPAGVAA